MFDGADHAPDHRAEASRQHAPRHATEEDGSLDRIGSPKGAHRGALEGRVETTRVRVTEQALGP
jgi:hypothetical protein